MAKTKEIEIDPNELERHPLSEIFPDLQGEEFEELKDSICESGLQHPILIDKNGYVIDGWQRCRAIQALQDEGVTDIAQNFEIVESPEDAVNMVNALNMARRQMSKMDKAKYALEVEEWRLSNVEGAKPRTRKELADAAGTSERTITSARNKKAGDDDKEPKEPKKSRADEFEEALIIERQDHSETKAKLVDAEERIALMQEKSKGVKELKTLVANQSRMEGMRETIDKLRKRVRSLEGQLKTAQKNQK